MKKANCPHLTAEGYCNAPSSQVRNRAFWHCQTVREIRNGCQMEIEKEGKDD